MKNTLTEIKNNLQGIHSRVEKAKNQISNLEYKEAKNTQKEKNPKKMKILGTTSSIPTFVSWGVPEEERKKLKIY